MLKRRHITSSSSDHGSRTAVLRWAVIGAALLAMCVVLTLVSHRFGYQAQVIDMPVAGLVTGLIAAGLLFACLARLIAHTEKQHLATQHLVLMIVLAGLAMRLILMAGTPVLEDDYQRYLWDGGVTAHGFNPYRWSPTDIINGTGPDALASLGKRSGPVLKRINHPGINTIYPPVAQALFAAAHFAAPWSLTPWRIICLIFDGLTLWLLFSLLARSGRSPLWAALYWWNPLVLKELFNSAHMEAVLLPIVLAALLLASTRRHLLSVGTLAVAAGIKLWPVLLLPLILRPIAGKPKYLFAALALFAGLCILWAAPILAVAQTGTTGFAIYAQKWQTNSALMPGLELVIGAITNTNATFSGKEGMLARGLVAALAVSLALWSAVKPWSDTQTLMARASVVIAGLVLLSPAQFPWYATWFAPFLCFVPLSGFIVLAATMPFYYASFHWLARGTFDSVRTPLVIAIWLPVWIALVVDYLRARSTGSTAFRRPWVNNGPLSR